MAIYKTLYLETEKWNQSHCEVLTVVAGNFNALRNHVENLFRYNYKLQFYNLSVTEFLSKVLYDVTLYI